MKLLRYIIALLSLTAFAGAQVAVSGHILNGSGHPIPGAYAKFVLVNCGDNTPTVYGVGTVYSTITFNSDPSTGAISGTIYTNDQITCAGQATTRWSETNYVNGQPQVTNNYYIQTGIPFNLDTATALGTIPAPPTWDNVYVRIDGSSVDGQATAGQVPQWDGTLHRYKPATVAGFNLHAPGPIGDGTPGTGNFSQLQGECSARAYAALNPTTTTGGIQEAITACGANSAVVIDSGYTATVTSGITVSIANLKLINLGTISINHTSDVLTISANGFVYDGGGVISIATTSSRSGKGIFVINAQQGMIDHLNVTGNASSTNNGWIYISKNGGGQADIWTLSHVFAVGTQVWDGFIWREKSTQSATNCCFTMSDFQLSGNAVTDGILLNGYLDTTQWSNGNVILWNTGAAYTSHAIHIENTFYPTVQLQFPRWDVFVSVNVEDPGNAAIQLDAGRSFKYIAGYVGSANQGIVFNGSVTTPTTEAIITGSHFVNIAHEGITTSNNAGSVGGLIQGNQFSDTCNVAPTDTCNTIEVGTNTEIQIFGNEWYNQNGTYKPHYGIHFAYTGQSYDVVHSNTNHNAFGATGGMTNLTASNFLNTALTLPTPISTADGAGNVAFIAGARGSSSAASQQFQFRTFIGASLNTMVWTTDASGAFFATSSPTATPSFTFDGPLIPDSAAARDLGKASVPWGNLFIGSGANNTAKFTGTFTGNRTVTVPDASGTLLYTSNVLGASLSTTASTTDNVTVTGMTASGHCTLTATNSSAATNFATTYISNKTTNQITVTHTATGSMTYDILCTSY